jgi:hypothetical protein
MPNLSGFLGDPEAFFSALQNQRFCSHGNNPPFIHDFTFCVTSSEPKSEDAKWKVSVATILKFYTAGHSE